MSNLSQANYHIIAIRHASEILLQLKTAQVSALLLACDFPEIHTYSDDVIRHSKAKLIPIILLGNNQGFDKNKSIYQAADDYISQPIIHDELLIKIKFLCLLADLKHQLKISEERLDILLRQSPTAIVYTDIQLNILKANAQFIAQYGSNQDSKQLSNQTAKLQLEKKDLEHFLQHGQITCETQFGQQDESMHWIQLNGKLIDQKLPEKGAIWTWTDITSHKNEQEQLQLAATVFDVSGEAMFIMDDNGFIKKTNPAMQSLFAYSANELYLLSAATLFAEPNDQLTINDILLTAKEQQWKGELKLRKKNNIQFPSRIIINSLKRADNSINQFVVLVADISIHKAQEQELKHRASHDPLTGLPNRREFFERLNKTLAIAVRNQYSVALLYLDLDGFKLINDTLGHGKGDEVLLEVADKLQCSIREVDTVARLGGDEFAIILNGTSENLVISTAERLIQIININLENSLHLTVSIGIAIFPHDTINPLKLLQFADEAMYKAKHQGKRSFCWHNTQTYSQSN